MTVLSDTDIKDELFHHDLDVTPVDLEEQLQPNSLDIRLGNEIDILKRSRGNLPIDAKEGFNDRMMDSFRLSDGESVIVGPDDFILADTKEWIEIPDYLYGELKGRSSIARLGLEIHSTGGVIDSGFEGDLVLEISNNTLRPVTLYTGMRVAQIIFHTLNSRCSEPYGDKDNKYQGQKGVTHSKIDDELS